MTTRRYQLVTRDGRLRLFRAAGAYLLERAAVDIRDVDTREDLSYVAGEVSARLYAAGLTGATEEILSTYATTLDSVDGLTTGRYDPDMWGRPLHTRDALILGYQGVADYCEGLAVLPA